MMLKILFIFLQPDPGRWGDPDELPINQDVWLLLLGALMLGGYMLYKSKHSKSHAVSADHKD